MIMDARLDPLVDGSQTPGVYRALNSADEVASRLISAGWAVAALGRTASKADFYTEVKQALAVGDYFGRNLDALWDCLTDLARPTVLIIPDWARLAAAEAGLWQRILAVLDERTEIAPPFAVVLAEPDLAS